jgi:glycerol-3-phosphate dehydrogenase
LGNQRCRPCLRTLSCTKLGVRPEFKITPRKGEYFIIDRMELALNTVLFPVPSEISKGILVTATMHENTLIGPNAQNQQDKQDKEVTQDGMAEVWQGAQKLIPSLNKRHVIATYAGLRAGGNASTPDSSVDYHNDFVIEIPTEIKGFVNLGGIESPGLTSAPAIALYVIDLLKDQGVHFEERADWNPIRQPRPKFAHLSTKEQNALIEMDPRYGRIICRCEMITEGEIVAEIHGPIPAGEL